MLSTLHPAFVGESALARMAARSNPWSMCEVLRVSAERSIDELSPKTEPSARALFLESFSLAQHQGALGWELRTATGLARFLGGHGEVADAHRLLLSVYGRFTEGFDTRDLLDAASLLNDLERSLPRGQTVPPLGF
jgi:predicted ATPase